jgi:GDP-L-fucose synthase
METNVTSAALQHGTEKLVFIGSSRIYPKHAEQPVKADALLTGPLKSTNEAHAIAKVAGVMMCNSIQLQKGRPFISLIPNNLYCYWMGGNYLPENPHLIPGLTRRFHEVRLRSAPSVTAWGTGGAMREFLVSDDQAAAAILTLREYNEPL